MNGPSEDLRQAVVSLLMRMEDEPDRVAEQRLLSTLELIGSEMSQDLEQREELGDDPASAFEELGAIEAWVSVVSAAMARVYAPTSPWNRRVAGWSKKVGERIRWLTNLLLTPLQAVKRALGADSCSISVAFPWGVSVDLSWT